ncbi:MAG: hypothetical protein ABI162_06925 [Luteolibacter sp.]
MRITAHFIPQYAAHPGNLVLRAETHADHLVLAALRDELGTQRVNHPYPKTGPACTEIRIPLTDWPNALLNS